MKRNIVNYPLVIIPLISLNLLLLNSNVGFYDFSYYLPRIPFWDLQAGINVVWPCYQKIGFDLFILNVDTFPSINSCSNYNYGYFSVFAFGFISLLNSSAVVVGFVQVFIFLFLVSKIYFAKNRLGKDFLVMVALFSPGVILLEVSGNLDIQIVNLLLLANITLNSGKEKFTLSLICLTSFLKFYTAPILFLACFFVKRRNSRIYGFFLSLFTAMGFSYQFAKTPLTPFVDGAQNKFGAEILDNYARRLGFNLSSFQGELIGLFSLLAVFFFIVFCYKKFKVINVTNFKSLALHSEMLLINFIFMAGTSVILYVTALNVDYKLTFIALAGIALIRLPQIRVKFISNAFPYIWLTSLWFSFPVSSISSQIHLDLQPIGDLAMIITIAYFMFQGVLAIKLIHNRD